MHFINLNQQILAWEGHSIPPQYPLLPVLQPACPMWFLSGTSLAPADIYCANLGLVQPTQSHENTVEFLNSRCCWRWAWHSSLLFGIIVTTIPPPPHFQHPPSHWSRTTGVDVMNDPRWNSVRCCESGGQDLKSGLTQEGLPGGGDLFKE